MFKQKEYLRERTGSMRQLATVRRAVLEDGKSRGMRIMEVNNGSGLSFIVYPDRGMDIGEAYFKGIPLAWMSKNGPVAPQFYEPEAFGWLRSWGGGLVTGCGFTNVGGPNTSGGEDHGLHGRLSHIPACQVNSKSEWNEAGFYMLEVTGEVRQSRVFGENLCLKRRISTALGDNSIVIEDVVENQGFQPTPFMQLYHMNLGWPLVDEGCTIEAVEHQVEPQNEIAAAGIAEWDQVGAPEAGFIEQVFYHHIPATDCGRAVVRLKNPKLKLAFKLEYRLRELPYFVQWKQMGQGEYVLGFEPANCFPEGQAAMAGRKLLRTLQPGEVSSSLVKITLEEL